MFEIFDNDSKDLVVVDKTNSCVKQSGSLIVVRRDRIQNFLQNLDRLNGRFELFKVLDAQDNIFSFLFSVP